MFLNYNIYYTSSMAKKSIFFMGKSSLLLGYSFKDILLVVSIMLYNIYMTYSSSICSLWRVLLGLLQIFFEISEFFPKINVLKTIFMCLNQFDYHNGITEPILYSHGL